LASFLDAVELTLENEGGYVNHPSDPGGATNFGISLRFLKTINPEATEDTIKDLTLLEAGKIYIEHFWVANRYCKIESQEVANKVFDMCVNMGQLRANKCLQSAVRAASGAELELDGIIGRNTLREVNEASSCALLAALKVEGAWRYVALVNADISRKVFLRGWLNRVYK